MPQAAPARKRPVTPLAESFTHRLHTLQKLTDKVTQDAYLAATGLPLGEGRCLTAVGAFAPLSVKDLAQLSNLNKSQASRAAQSLVDRGLVIKQGSEADGRGVVLMLSPEGRSRWEATVRLIARRNRDIFGCLNARELATLDRLLDRLVAHNERR